MESIKSLLSPLAPLANTALGPSSPLTDTLKLVVIGGTVETARRASVSAWNGFVDSFFLTAHFSPEDYPYDWLMHWLSKQPAWSKSREFEITTRSGGIKPTSGVSNTQDDEDEDLDSDEEEQEEELVHGRKKREVAFLPSIDTTHTIYYRGHWLRITRCRGQSSGYHHSPPSLKISTIARSNTILKKLVLEAKREYEKDAEHRVHIFLGDTTYAHWRWNGARQKRPMSSIVLQPGVKDMLLNDCKDFLASEGWYASRGIPFRRGYLLHGVPGSGKTSLIHSLAGELGLDIYVVSLSAKGMSDTTLTQLMSNVPSRCILLLEDLDAAFTRGVSRDAGSTGAPTSSTSSSTTTTDANNTNAADTGSTLSLSGLLNSLDGVAAAEGRLLFATTNHIERLDPALSRPGRMDVWVNFGNATREQAEGIFKCFFPGSATEDDEPVSKEAASLKVAESAAEATALVDISQRNLPGHTWTESILNSFYGAPTQPAAAPRRKRKAKVAATITVPQLAKSEIATLAKEFAASIPEDELSVASLQGYLLRNKTRPRECVQEVAEWVKTERETREKIKKEKEKEKEKKEKEEKEKKEKEEKEKKEAEDKAKAELEAAEKAKAAAEVKPAEEVTPPPADSEAKKKEKEAEEKKLKEKEERRKARKAKKAAAAAALAASTSTTPPPADAATPAPASTTSDSASTSTPTPTTTDSDTQEPTPPPSSNESPVETESESSSPTEAETDGGDADAEESDSASSTDEAKVKPKEKWVKVQGEEEKKDKEKEKEVSEEVKVEEAK